MFTPIILYTRVPPYKNLLQPLLPCRLETLGSGYMCSSLEKGCLDIVQMFRYLSTHHILAKFLVDVVLLILFLICLREKLSCTCFLLLLSLFI